MNIQKAFDLTNTTTAAQLARLLKITPQAICQWDRDKIPEKSELAVYKAIGALDSIIPSAERSAPCAQ